jgi:3-hydroxyisobutyrate dehydrogenase/2-hydroxy-3-oxopropionate reductase
MTGSDLIPPAQLACIGLGALGLPMAVNLHSAGYRLQVHTRSRHAEADPALAGTTASDCPAAAVRGCRALVLCVSDDAAVETVLWGAQGAGPALERGSLVIDCSTIGPSTAQAMAQRLAEQDVRYIDAPVTGGTEGAKAGSLTVLCGGDAPDLERARPLLDVLGGSIHHFGSVGSGQQVKAINQVLVAGSYAAVAEAISLGQRLELPMPQVIDALKNGAAGSWALEHRSSAMLEGSYPLGFRLSLHRKDLGIALDAAKAVQLDLPVTTLVEQLELDLIQNGHGDEDVSALHRWNQTRQES